MMIYTLLSCGEKLYSLMKKTLWLKRYGDEDFDVLMRSYDGAEACELVGPYLLNKLSSIVDK